MSEWYKLRGEDKYLEIDYDSCPESPREWCNLGTFITFERRNRSPDENPFSDVDELCEEFGVKKVNELNKSKKYIVGYVSKYEHSGLCYSFNKDCVNNYSCPWDSGICGVIYASKEDIMKEYSVKRISKKIRERVYEVFNGEVELYSQWVNGDVFSYRICDKNGECLDSCCGFYSEKEIVEEFGLTDEDYLGDYDDFHQAQSNEGCAA